MTLLLIGALLAGCASLGEPHYRMPAVEGKVKDMETSKPVKGAVALAVYGGNTVSGYVDVDAQEATTDTNGEFLVPDTKVFNKGDYGKLRLSHLYILAPGYFPTKNQAVSDQTITLRKMTHYLHYRKLPEFALNVPGQNSITSAGYKGWLHAVKSPWLTKLSATGVFLQDPARKFTKVFWQNGYYEEDLGMGGSFLWAYDENNQQWSAIDCTGKNAPDPQFAMNNWDSMSGSPKAPPIFAGKESIFIPPDRNKQKTGADNKVVRITPVQGGISGITGDSNRFYTIEGDGICFCIYELKSGGNEPGENGYTTKAISRGEISIFSNVTSALPTLEAISSIRLHSTPYIILLTKSADDWRILLCRKDEHEYYFEPILLFPPEQEIAAIASSGTDDAIYIAFKNGKIRKYYAKEKSSHLGEFFIEDETFAAQANVSFPEIVSMTVGANDLTGNALYAATKNGVIYRLAADGTPDYRAKFEGSLP
ncbi:MAG: carboxypeptidase-like regulatory domain-containing protein [Proteobacteria bacterium]|nr:carboxypeptidase-like regulatory domain-containing protein [Pseudomonadota bacterium]MBU4297573.1 carboxypeptidase-like regulatory domain-containing protein [Pseudomonadota bacterium]